MNIETGEIKQFKEGDKIPDGFVPIIREQMTKKQARNMQVSKYDSVSELGRLFTGNRKQRREQAKALKRKLKRGRKK